MRTTVTIDDVLLVRAKVMAAQTHRTLGEIVDEGLRAVLSAPRRMAVTLPDFSYEGGLVAGVDLYDRDALAELLDDADS